MSEETRDIQSQEGQKQEVAGSSAERTRDRVAFVPRADIYETNEAIVVVADMPGVNESSVEIALEQNVLTINGYVEPSTVDGYHLAYAEYRVGDYQRSFTIPNKVDQEKIEATVSNGMLRLYLPKAEPVSKKIAVKAG